MGTHGHVAARGAGEFEEKRGAISADFTIEATSTSPSSR
jgi:hypothetical protein